MPRFVETASGYGFDSHRVKQCHLVRDVTISVHTYVVSRYCESRLVRNVLNVSMCIAARVTLEEFALSTHVTWSHCR